MSDKATCNLPQVLHFRFLSLVGGYAAAVQHPQLAYPGHNLQQCKQESPIDSCAHYLVNNLLISTIVNSY